jgi:hypothetical protein
MCCRASATSCRSLRLTEAQTFHALDPPRSCAHSQPA